MNIVVHNHDGSSQKVAASEGDTLLKALQDAGVVVLAPCGGNGTCGRCKVLVRDGSGVDYRLACQTSVTDDMEVILEDVGSMRIAGAEESDDEPDEAGMRTASASDNAAQGTAPEPCATDGTAGADAPCAESDAELGLAVDIGTTTMVFYLVDLETRNVLGTLGKVNPQATFGADVIARINAANAPGGLDLLCGTLERGLVSGTHALCARLGVDPARVARAVMVGNTTMEHFACGLDPSPIGVSPFTPRSLFGCEMPLFKQGDSASTTTGATDAEIPVAAKPASEAASDRSASTPAPSGVSSFPAFSHVYFTPAVAGYVGGDITAGLHVAGMAESEGVQLFLDIGTNGEMALGNRDRMICCATAAGPAFEGASITFGMPAMPGAISKVQLVTDGLEAHTIDDRPPLGLCGSGLLDAVACLIEAGIVDETGYLCDEDEVDAAFAHLIGEEHGQTVCYLDPDHRVYLTQGDVRKIQLAKGAIRAGIETMIKELGVTYDDIVTASLAGGFGMHLRAASAARVGLIPPALLDRVQQLGNAAGCGAVRALFPDERTALEQTARACEYLELSTSTTFNTLYIDLMSFEED